MHDTVKVTEKERPNFTIRSNAVACSPNMHMLMCRVTVCHCEPDRLQHHSADHMRNSIDGLCESMVDGLRLVC